MLRCLETRVSRSVIRPLMPTGMTTSAIVKCARTATAMKIFGQDDDDDDDDDDEDVDDDYTYATGKGKARGRGR